MNVLGIDYGASRVGIAYGSPTVKIASPLEVIPNKGAKEVIKRIEALVAEYSVKTLVVGLPLSLTGKETEQTDEVYVFVELLRDYFDLEIVLEDERFTSRSAQDLLKEAGGKKKSQDDVAAMLILQTYFDRA
jgi:putative Holliday junction resolvase